MQALSSADLFSPLQNQLFQKILSGTLSVSNGFDPYQDQGSVIPDLGPNCLQRFSADDKSCHYQQKS